MESRFITTINPAKLMKRLMCIIPALIVGMSPAIKAEEILNAKGMTVYGQRELPKVMYIVPWKKTKSADIDMPMTESLVADVLDPIDPEVFRRQIKYYELMHSSKD